MAAKAKARAKEKTEKKEVCKKILGDARQTLNDDIEESNQFIHETNQMLAKKAKYVSNESYF